jgi:hypothetical protein
MKNETSTPNIFRPFRAGRRVDVFLGLKPQAESYCPFGAEVTHTKAEQARGDRQRLSPPFG